MRKAVRGSPALSPWPIQELAAIKDGKVNLTRQRTGGRPVLRSAQELACDGRNPNTDDPCILGYHQGPHRDSAGAAWLDDGDLARPDGLNP